MRVSFGRRVGGYKQRMALKGVSGRMRNTRLSKVGAFLLRTKFIPVLLLLTFLTGGAALYFSQANPAHADPYTSSTLHYPWVNATALRPSTYDYGYSTCPPTDPHCKYYAAMLYTVNKVVYGEADPWGYFLRNCTSYVAWKLSQLGVDPKYFTGLGNGGDWYDTAKYRYDHRSVTPYQGSPSVGTSPKIGAAAVVPSTWGYDNKGKWVEKNPGHVAFVSNITYNTNGSVKTITINEFNAHTPGNGDIWTGPPASRNFKEYVYFGTLEKKLPTSITVKGTVNCASHPLYGIWVQSSGGGSGFASWSWTTSNHYAGTYTRTLSTTLPTTLQLHVGCGGSRSSWWSDNWTLSVSDLASVTLNATCNEGTIKPAAGSNSRCLAPTVIVSL